MAAVPDPIRPALPFVADEGPMLGAWLDFQRETLPWKCQGLDDESLRTASIPPSTLTLLGLVRHLTKVEHYWYVRVFEGSDERALYVTADRPDADFTDLHSATVAQVFATYRQVIARARAVAAGVAPDALSVGERHGGRVSMRWIQVHMIEEYARHLGHADLLRECLDGVTGY